ncbi:hypothetical protein LCY76_16980 [Fictibacillus sp. KIGAM418]|uniref:Uncharacterized protein n=1 Tax=Fictibacillus marinisediminis TaxID=2878389 RepID=A0A9X1XIU7_9BACL|nr:hypothetical protein [Fictibacillus marinisediminis]MCK6258269.1 hypothetical protein [Fictibacillus marinisediminis]
MISWLKRRIFISNTYTLPDNVNPITTRSSAATCLEPKTISPDKEVEHYKSRLLQFGIDICQMPKWTPQTKNRRKEAFIIASYIANDIELRSFFLNKKSLPTSQLLKNFQKKSITRYAPYIIATALIVIEDYHYLKGYLPE